MNFHVQSTETGNLSMNGGRVVIGLSNRVRLVDAERGRANNLNLLRFILASLVILSHSFAILNRGRDEPSIRFLHFNANLGDIAVFGFFFISGYLILKSALRRPDPRVFLRARALRIFPALLLAVLLVDFVAGPIFTTLGVAEYLDRWPVWRYLGTVILSHNAGLYLPGLFQNRFIPEANLPIWTLSSEWFMYLAALLAALCIGPRAVRQSLPRRSFVVLLVVVLISLQMLPLPLHYSWKWMLSFLVGSCAFLLRDRIVFFFPLAVTAFVLDLGLIRFLPKAGKPAFPLLLFYLLLVVGFHPRLYMRWFERIGDLSYGLYIYAWPIQQMWAGRIHSPWKLFVVSYACVLPVASLSWHLLESRCLAWKGRRTEAAADASGVRVAW